MKVESRPRIYGRWFLRILIGLVVLLTSLGKAMDPEGFQKILGEYQALPGWALFPAAALIINVEFAIAIWLLIGWRMRQAALTAAGMHLLYAFFTGAAVVRGLSLANCGCFGVFLPRRSPGSRRWKT